MTEKFLGFPRPTANHFLMPLIWIDICAYIDNLAELKIVQYVLRHTWAASEFLLVRRITVDEFMFGVKDEGTGKRLDSGTGLRSEQSVRTGLKKAQEHGFLICEVDASDGSNIKKYYRLNIYSEVQSLDPQRLDPSSGVQSLEVQTLDPQHLEVQSLDPTFCSTTSSVGVQHLDRIREEKNSIVRKNSNARTPKWIRTFAEDCSRDFNDTEHIGPNIVQLRNLYRESTLAEEEFQALIYQAREITKRAIIRKKNAFGHPNRMPYFFTCLRGLMFPPENTEATS